MFNKFFSLFTLIALACCWCPGEAQAQEKATLSGYIKDASNGETLIGATVFVSELGTGTTSNEYGFYSISIRLNARAYC